MDWNRMLYGDAVEQLKLLPDAVVQCVITSPPYFGLRNYSDSQREIGAEKTLTEYLSNLLAVFDECWRILKDDGTAWVNLGDCYCSTSGQGNKKRQSFLTHLHDMGLKPKDRIGVPWRFAFAMQDRGWTLRSDIVWRKMGVIPEPVRDRPHCDHEYIFMFSKSRTYKYNYQALLDYTREAVLTDTWHIKQSSERTEHIAVFPPEIPMRCMIAGSDPGGDLILDPFMGSGTTAQVAQNNGRLWVGCELNPIYAKLIERKTSQLPLVP